MASTVLLVEDDADIRDDLAFFIEAKGRRVATAADGAEALRRLAEIEPPCIIILDLMMPVMNGWELRQRLLASPELAAIPVVLLSGIADLEGQAASLDAVGYLRKPIDLDELHRVIDAHC